MWEREKPATKNCAMGWLSKSKARKRKSANASFVERAPADVVEKERASLAELEQQLATTLAALEKLSLLKS